MMNPDTGTLTSEQDAKDIFRALTGKTNPENVFPENWPRFSVGATVIIMGVDCKIIDIDGRQITVMPIHGIWPKVRRLESVQIVTAHLRVWKVSKNGIVLRHPKQCVEESVVTP